MRTVAYRPGPTPGWATASVDMGPARLGPDQPQEFDDRRARTVDVGNPHLVLLGPDTASVDVAELGPKLQAAFSGGINVEWITSSDRRTGRRCSTSGSGSAGWARRWPVAPAAWPPPPRRASWGVLDDGAAVRVRNPGGTLEVTFGADGETTFLAGPVRKVADVDIHPGMLS